MFQQGKGKEGRTGYDASTEILCSVNMRRGEGPAPAPGKHFTLLVEDSDLKGAVTLLISQNYSQFTQFAGTHKEIAQSYLIHFTQICSMGEHAHVRA